MMKQSSELSLCQYFPSRAKTIRMAKGTIEEMDIVQNGDVEKISITSNISQQVGTMVHQTKFTQLVIDTSSECLRLLSDSQWPEVLSSSV